MKIKTKKFSVVVITLVSAFLFCSVLVFASLSPLADSGPNSNEFGSLGMWIAIGIVLVFYVLPLIAFVMGVDLMRLVMAVLCGFGILIQLLIILSISVISEISERMTPALIILVILCVATLITNVIWFFVVFRSSSKSSEQNQSALPNA